MAAWTKTGSGLALVCLACLLAPLWANAADSLTLAIQPTTVVRGDIVKARVTADRGVKGRPSLLGAGGFEVVASSHSDSVQFINGALSVSRSYVFSLRALKSGNFKITAAAKTRGGSLRSRPVQVTVVGQQRSQTPLPSQTPNAGPSQQGGKPYFVETRVSKNDPYVGQLVLVEYHVYLREDVQVTANSFSITTMPEFVGFTGHELPKSNRLNFEPETIGGQNYQRALLQRFAVFPAAVGDQALGTMRVEFRYLDSRRRGGDPFFGLPMFGNARRAAADSDPVKIRVKPLPAEGKPGDFSGLVGRFSMKAELDRNQVSAGEPFTLTMVVEGRGNIDQLKRPKIDLPAGLRIYSDKDQTDLRPSIDTISGSKTFETILLADQPGDFTIAPIVVSFFDPQTGAYDQVASPPLSIKVRGQAMTPGQNGISVISREAVEVRGRDLRYIRRDKESLDRTSAAWVAAPVTYVAIGLWPLFVFLVILFQIRQGRLRADRGGYRSRRAMKEAKARLAAARGLTSGEGAAFYAELQRALLGFVADKFNVAAPGLERFEVEALLRERDVTPEHIETLLALWHETDAARFGGIDTAPVQRRQALGKARRLIADLAGELER
ncbi:MAG: BatD family protein [Candidatus Lernaella stagnicola]|nr:BatD family protein [Candidatus Lernaella stagnicola]